MLICLCSFSFTPNVWDVILTVRHNSFLPYHSHFSTVTLTMVFDICGSVHHHHHHPINKTTNMMQLGAIVFIILEKALYMFRVIFAPIIRSVLN